MVKRYKSPKDITEAIFQIEFHGPKKTANPKKSLEDHYQVDH